MSYGSLRTHDGCGTLTWTFARRNGRHSTISIGITLLTASTATWSSRSCTELIASFGHRPFPRGHDDIKRWKIVVIVVAIVAVAAVTGFSSFRAGPGGTAVLCHR